MAKPPTPNRQLSMLLPIVKEPSTVRATKNAVGSGVKSTSPQFESRRDALIERLRRDGYFDLRKK
jgi:hypothetical protein